ncbi:restriction endonuclease subunit S [Streptomyces vinaceus]|uniref:restriction endonuclease subunit S n=1 Tax=Streptomyces vinaceus TaxID=1960 RepID=UPI0035DF08CA
MVKIGAGAVEDLEIPLPRPEEQSRIVAVHDAIERRIAAMGEVRTKLAILRRTVVDDLVAGPTARVGTLLTRRPRNGYSPLEVPEWSGLLAVGLGCLTTEGFRPRQLKSIPDSDMARRFLLADGDLLMSRANTRELVGLAGLYKDVGHPCIYPDLMMRLTVDRELCLPDYLELALSTPKLRRAIQAGARGTSESMVKISAEFAESLEVPVPSIEAQHRAVLAVAALDSRIAKQEVAIQKLRVVQQGVMEDLLMVRVHEEAGGQSTSQRRPTPIASGSTLERKVESVGRPTLTTRSG